jgi:hypothetical protein
MKFLTDSTDFCIWCMTVVLCSWKATWHSNSNAAATLPCFVMSLSVNFVYLKMIYFLKDELGYANCEQFCLSNICTLENLHLASFLLLLHFPTPNSRKRALPCMHYAVGAFTAAKLLGQRAQTQRKTKGLLLLLLRSFARSCSELVQNVTTSWLLEIRPFSSQLATQATFPPSFKWNRFSFFPLLICMMQIEILGILRSISHTRAAAAGSDWWTGERGRWRSNDLRDAHLDKVLIK